MSTPQAKRLVGYERRRVEKEVELKHHIPSSLIDLLPSLNTVRLREHLAKFATAYKDKNFVEEPEEYRMLSDAISEILGSLNLPQEMITKVDRIMAVDRAYSEADSEYREHFVHAFQVFLLGMVVVDKHHKIFRNWFSDELCEDSRASVESAWLLASIFHDHLKSVKPLIQLARGLLGKQESELPPISEEITNVEELRDWIDGAYSILSNSGRLSRKMPAGCLPTKLMPILDEYRIKDNHGVVAGLNMLNWIRSSGEEATSTDAIASLAMALHDSDYPHEHALPEALFSAGVFPIRFDRQPISCLLLWCDAVQEWVRWTHRQEVDTRLVNITCEDDTVNFRLSFDDPNAVNKKFEELQYVGECIQESDLKFTFDFRVHPADLGLRRRMARKK